MTRAAILSVVLCLLQACSSQKEVESGYLLQNDERYSEIHNPEALFGDPGVDPATLAFDSSQLDADRSYLRYRVIFGTHYYTVHSRPDPEFSLPAGEYTIGLQAIQIRQYVAENRIHYGVPVSVDLKLAASERTVVQLAADDQSEFKPYVPPTDRDQGEEEGGDFIKIPLPTSPGTGGT